MKKLSVLLGARYLNRNLIINSLDTDSEFNPQSYDIQTNINYKINHRWAVGFVGNFNNTLFEQIPHTRETNFGTLQRPISLSVYYRGNEKDRFNTKFGAFSTYFTPNSNWHLSLDLFAYHTIEQEYFDIEGAYLIREINPETGDANPSSEIGGQIDHARNDLDMLVTGVQHRGKYKINNNTNLEWGVSAQKESIRDLQNEWQMIDFGGYNIRPNHPEKVFLPGEVNKENLELNYAVNAKNELTSNRYTAYTQWNKKFFWNDAKVLFNAGARATYSDLNNELNISPRMLFAIRPDWVTSQLFRFSAGYYVQPPFYKELKNPYGIINKNVKSQKSIHFIAGHDYEFFMWERPFKFTTEVYYKNMTDINPYYIENVRVKYTAENNAIGRAYGIDTRLYGEFIPGSDSWLSLSYAKVQQNIDNQGWIARPTEPRFKASLFFQDYMPIYPSLKVNVNLIYASGLPNGAPLFTNPYNYTNYLPDYKRVDIGLSKIIVDTDKNKKLNGFFSGFKTLSVGLDVFNVFDIRNTVSNQWIVDVNSSTVYGVPNRTTGRFYNLNINMSF